MAKVQTLVDVTIRLDLTEIEAEFLRTMLQNTPSGFKESPEERELRKGIYKALDDQNI